MTTALVIDTKEFKNFEGQEVGRELELEVTAVVSAVAAKEGDPPTFANAAWGDDTIELTILRIDITQTT